MTALARGTRLGPYVISEPRATDSSGERWSASEPGVERPVDLTVTPLPRDRGAREAILDAQRRRAALEHPSLLPVYGAGEEGDLAWIATPAPIGRPLETAAPMPAGRADRILAEIRGALAALAGAGIAPSLVGPGDVLLEGERAYLVPRDTDGGGDSSGAERSLDAALRARTRAGSPRRRAVLAGAVAVAAVVVAVGLVLASRDGDPPAAPSTGPAGRVVATIPTNKDDPVVSIAFAGAKGWAVTSKGSIARIDTATNTLVGPGTKIRRFGGKIEAHDGSLWLAADDGLLRLDPSTLHQTGRIAVPARALFDFAFAGHSLWVTTGDPARFQHGRLRRFDPERLTEVGKPLALPFGAPIAMAAGDRALWVSAREGGTVTRVDLAGGAPVSTVVGLEADIPVAAGDAVWVPTSGDETLVRVGGDGAIERVARVAGMPFVTASTGSAIWVESLQPAEIQRVDPETGAAVGAPIAVTDAGDLAAGQGDLWVAEPTAILRIHPTDPGPTGRTIALAADGILPPGPVTPNTRLATESFLAPLSLEVPSDDWLSAASRQRDGVTLVSRRATEDPWNVVAYAPRALYTAAGGLQPMHTRADALAALRARPDLDVGVPRASAVGGVPATEVEVTVARPRPITGLCDTPCTVLFPLGQGLTIDLRAGERITLRLLERAGRVLFVWYSSGGGFGDDRYRAEAESIIASIRFSAR